MRTGFEQPGDVMGRASVGQDDHYALVETCVTAVTPGRYVLMSLSLVLCHQTSATSSFTMQRPQLQVL